MIRHGQLVGIKKEKLDEYVRYHANVWPEVLKTIKDCNIRNYSIYQHGEQLFAYFEYTGDDFNADMRKMAADETTQKWWAIMKPMQSPIGSESGEPEWIELREVFHAD